MNITLIQAKHKPLETIYCPITPEEFKELQRAGIVAKRKRIYHMVLDYRAIQLECPVQLDGKNPVGVILPAFKLPYRKYPVFVYLYAIALYLSGKSMRTAARETAEKFGVPNFSHSTISRTLNALTIKTDELTAICPPAPELSLDAAKDCVTPPALPGQPTPVIRPYWSDSRKQAAPHLLNILTPLFSSSEYGSILAYRYFTKYGRLLL